MNSSMKCGDILPIPMDLVIEIFSRLPRKSIGRCRCLSKFWAYVIGSQYFIDLWETKSSARPQILLAHSKKGRFSFFYADQPQEVENLCDIALNHLPDGPKSYKVGVPINGLLCLSNKIPESIAVIYNPSTGEFLNLPKMKTPWKHYTMMSYLGYDPTEKQFKVLSYTFNGYCPRAYIWDMEDLAGGFSVEYQVLTLEETGRELSWRKIECVQTHHPRRGEICINGMLYYPAFFVESLLVCFDVRSETFRFIEFMETFNCDHSPYTTKFTNYGGKLGVLMTENANMNGGDRSFELWVLKDIEQNEWSKNVYVLPPIGKNMDEKNEKNNLVFLGMIGTNEVVLYPDCRIVKWYHLYKQVPPYIFYYNIEKNTIRRVDIQGRNSSGHEQVYMFLNHVEKPSLF